MCKEGGGRATDPWLEWQLMITKVSEAISLTRSLMSYGWTTQNPAENLAPDLSKYTSPSLYVK